MDSPAPATMDELLQHAVWVRNLARRLVGDPDLAEDLAQDAVLVALKVREPPRSWKAWLGSVVRNLASERRRKEERRQRREQSVLGPQEEPSTLELLEKVSAHREVVDVLVGLPEHYQQILLHRYYNQETPTQIAERLGMPVSTVKTRLQRGLERMREALDDRHEGRQAWVLLMAPLVRGLPPGAAPPPAGSEPAPSPAATNAAAKFTADAAADAAGGAGATGSWAPVAGLVALVLVLGAGLWRWAPWDGEAGAGSAELGTTAEIGEVGTPGRSGAARGGGELASALADSDQPGAGAPRVSRTEPAAADREASSSPLGSVALQAPPRPSRGVVLGPDGARRTGVLLRFEPDPTHPFSPPDDLPGMAIALSGEGGAYTFASLGRPGTVSASPPWVTVMSARIGWKRSDEAHSVVVSEARRLQGRVVDAEGRGVPAARLRFRVSDSALRRLPMSLERSVPAEWRAAADGDGAFTLAEMPAGLELDVRVSAAGYETIEQAVPADASPLELAMGSLAGARLRGVVVDARGLPLGGQRDGAVVSDGRRVVRCDAEGRFVLLREDREPATLIACAPGRRSLTQEVAAGVDESLRLILSEPSLGICGTVLDPDGRPREGLRVFVADPTLMLEPPSAPGSSAADGELAHGGGPAAEAEQDRSTRVVWAADLDEGEIPWVREAVAAGSAGSPWCEVRTDARGRFEIRGLEDRPYRVVALDPVTLAHVEQAGVAAGESALRLDLQGVQMRAVRGRLVDVQGRPVPGVHVDLDSPVMQLHAGGRAVYVQRLHGAGSISGPDGEFELQRVPGCGLGLVLRHRERLIQQIPLDESDQDLLLVLERKVQMRCELAPGDPADRVRVLDDQGRELVLHHLRGDERRSSLGAEVVEGLSAVLTFSERARFAVLLRGDEELRRVPLALQPGEIAVLR